MQIEDRTTVQAAENLTVASLSGEAVILDSVSGRYYGLNEVGARVFSLAEQPLAVDQIVERVKAEYDVAPEQLREDVVTFVSDMVEKSLMRVC